MAILNIGILRTRQEAKFESEHLDQPDDADLIEFCNSCNRARWTDTFNTLYEPYSDFE